MAIRLRAVRRVKGVSQEALARQLGVAKTVLCRWEQADVTPDYAMVALYAKACGFNGEVAKWIGFGGSVPSREIGSALREVEREFAERQRAKGAA